MHTMGRCGVVCAAVAVDSVAAAVAAMNWRRVIDDFIAVTSTARYTGLAGSIRRWQAQDFAAWPAKS